MSDLLDDLPDDPVRDPVGDPLDGLGFARTRLVRHSTEQPEALVPSADAAGARHVVFLGDRLVVEHGTTLRAAPPPGVEVRQRLFLGRLDGAPVFAVGCAEAPATGEGGPSTLDLRSIATDGAVAPDELGLLATAKSMLDWHGRNGFCANCGSPTLVRAGGYRRECPACQAHHFPRTDPVVIMLVRRGERCLLGRGPHFKPGMYSCLAGFLEPGETVEAAVRREVCEETGVRVGQVAYHASQPWPFPSSLMLGCVAEALDETIAADPAELEDARWFDRAAVALMLAGRHPEGVFAPPPMAIAHVLLRAFVGGRA